MGEHGGAALRSVGSIFTRFIAPVLVASIIFVGLVYFVFPTSTWIDQRAEAAQLESDLANLSAEQTQLRQAIARMRTPAEIERIARRDFNLVFPGEEAYAVLPAPPAALNIPPAWPFSLLYDELALR